MEIEVDTVTIASAQPLAGTLMAPAHELPAVTLIRWLTEMIVGGRQSVAKERLDEHNQAQVLNAA